MKKIIIDISVLWCFKKKVLQFELTELDTSGLTSHDLWESGFVWYFCLSVLLILSFHNSVNSFETQMQHQTQKTRWYLRSDKIMFI